MQKLNAKNIDRVLKNKTKDFEVTPPDYLWNQVAQSIPDYVEITTVGSRSHWFLISSLAFTFLLNFWLLVLVEEPNVITLQSGAERTEVIDISEATTKTGQGLLKDSIEHPLALNDQVLEIELKEGIPFRQLVNSEHIKTSVPEFDLIDAKRINFDMRSITESIQLITPTKPKLPNERWSFGLSYVHYQADRVITARNVQNGAYIAKMRDEYDKQDMAIQMRLMAKYEVSRSISISAGIAYGRWNESFGLMSAPRGLELDSAAIKSGHHPDHLHKPGKEKVHRNQYRQFEIPVMVHYQARFRNRLSLVNSLGFSVVWQELEQGTQCYDFRINHFAPTHEFIRNENLNFYFESALALRLNKQWQIEMGPSIRYTFFSHFNAAYPILQNNLGIGAHLSVRYYPSL